MKKITIIAIIFSLHPLSEAQVLTTRTNTLLLQNQEGKVSYPVIRWRNIERNTITVFENPVELDLEVSSESFMKKVVLTVMDGPDTISVKELYSSEYPEKKKLELSQNVHLTEGFYQVKITAETHDAGKTYSSKEFVAGEGAIRKVTTERRNDYALLIATDEYYEWEGLNNPIFDAEAIGDELSRNYNFKVEILKNPTADEIILKLREYSHKTYQSGDQLFIFFAGHGHFEESFGEGFIVAKDSKKSDPSFSSYISHSRLGTIINNLPCEHIMVCMDVCFGGAFSNINAGHRGNPDMYSELSIEEFIERKLKYKTRIFITSGGTEYVSDGIPGKHSPFSRRLIAGLRNYGGSDGVITFSEIITYIERAQPQPRFGEFGDNQPGSDFLMIFR